MQGCCLSCLTLCRRVFSLSLLPAIFVFSLMVSPSPLHAGDTVPDWVHAAMAQPPGAISPEAKAVVLLDETTVTIGADGKGVEHRRRVIKILRPTGRDEGYVGVWFDNDTKILSLHVWSVAPDGHEYAVKDADMRDEGFGSGEFFVDDKARVANPPGRDPGGVIAYEYDQRLASYDSEKTWVFQDDIPHVKQSLTLILPANYTYGTVWAHHEASQAIDLEHQRYRWELNDTPEIDLDHVSLHPSLGALAGRMTVYFGPNGSAAARMGTWKGIGEWYDALAHDRLAASPEIEAKAHELTAGKTDFYDKAEAIGDFVQTQIRYFVVERGIGGLQPHPAANIFHSRYGDCKDKATVLSAMLSTVGIHSVIVLVDTRRGVVDPLAPSLFGNHAIAAIELPKGYESARLHSVVTTKAGRRYLIFDPTWEKTPFGQLEANLQGSYGTLVDGADSDEVRLPVMSPELNTIQRKATLELRPDGSLKGVVTERRFGDLSENTRRLFSSGDEKEQKQYMDRVLGRDLVDFSITGLKVENVATLNKSLTLNYDLEAGRYARHAGSLLMVRPRVFGSEVSAIDHAKRRFPVDLKQTMQVRDDYTIELPSGYVIDEVPEAVKIDVGFAAYESHTEVKGSSLHYTRTYTVRDVVVSADHYGDLERLAGVIGNDEQNQAVLKKQQ